MRTQRQNRFFPASAAASLAAFLIAGYAAVASAQEVKVTLSGAQEIPPVTTSASGTGTLTVAPDKSVSGSVNVAGLVVTAAHIHEAPAGRNGPVIIPLTRVSDAVWAVPAGAKLTDAQFDSFRAGNLYFNMHSDAHKAGEIRGQIKP